MENVEYLRKYHKDVQIMTDSYKEINEIPDEWKTALGLPKEERKEYIIGLWKKNFGDLLCQLIAYMEKNLVTIDLIHYRDKYSLLYGIKSNCPRQNNRVKVCRIRLLRILRISSLSSGA